MHDEKIEFLKFNIEQIMKKIDELEMNFSCEDDYTEIFGLRSDCIILQNRLMMYLEYPEAFNGGINK
jgi:hypothetical protein